MQQRSSGISLRGAPLARCLILVLSLSFSLFLFYSLVADPSENRILSTSYVNGKRRDNGPYGSQPFDSIIVHLDLKGAPPLVTYYAYLFPLLKKLGVDAVLMEYEDMFPYEGRLELVRRSGHYNKSEIVKINELAALNGLEVIPLVQTFGHMEFVLKHGEFMDLSENPYETNTICPSDNRSLDLIMEIIRQIRVLHPSSTRIHIGADEAYHIGEDERCQKEMEKTGDIPAIAEEKIKLQHIARVAHMAKAAGFQQVLAWNDMFASSSVEHIKMAGLGELIVPVIWGYAADVTRKDYFPDGLFQRTSEVFSNIWFASAYKGANGQNQTFINVDRYLENHKSYVNLYQGNAAELEGRVRGLVMTGWQRFSHGAPLCELLPVAIPSLVLNTIFAHNVQKKLTDVNRETKEFLHCPVPTNRTIFTPVHFSNETYYPMMETLFGECEFEGKQLYRLVMSDLRFLTWKIKRFGGDQLYAKDFYEEIDKIAKKLSIELSRYYSYSDIEEFVNYNVRSLRRYIA